MTGRDDAADTNRDRIIAAAAGLLAAGGREAVSTRAVCAAAGVQAPTIYRIFGDKQGLLDAVAAHGFAAYVTGQVDHEAVADPVEDLRAGWDQHIGFGLTHPALYALIYGDPRPSPPPAAVALAEVVVRKVHRIAEAGRLQVSEERATKMMIAAGTGTTLTLIATPEGERDSTLSHSAREALIAAVTTDVPASVAPGPAGAAIAMRAVLPQATALTAREQALMSEWLDRIADG